MCNVGCGTVCGVAAMAAAGGAGQMAVGAAPAAVTTPCERRWAAGVAPLVCVRAHGIVGGSLAHWCVCVSVCVCACV